MTNIKLEKQTIAKILVLFAISYVLLFFLGMLLNKWDSPMFFLPPIAGFFFAFFLVDWIDKFNETTAAHQWFFPFLILLLALFAQYINLFWYFQNIFSLSGKGLEITFGLGDPMTLELENSLKIGFVSQLKASAFLPFTLACILGWLAHLIIEQTQKKQ